MIPIRAYSIWPLGCLRLTFVREQDRQRNRNNSSTQLYIASSNVGSLGTAEGCAEFTAVRDAGTKGIRLPPTVTCMHTALTIETKQAECTSQ
jgi:hypothetical protein